MLYQNRLDKDWNFTDTVHNKLAEPLYISRGYSVKKATFSQDSKDGIDYIITRDEKTFTVQERFRKAYKITQNSKEFTLRDQRPNSTSAKQRQSELFKIKADLLLYGIIDSGSINTSTKFLRYVVVSVKNLLIAIDRGDILIDLNESNNKNNPWILKRFGDESLKRSKI